MPALQMTLFMVYNSPQEERRDRFSLEVPSIALSFLYLLSKKKKRTQNCIKQTAATWRVRILHSCGRDEEERQIQHTLKILEVMLWQSPLGKERRHAVGGKGRSKVKIWEKGEGDVVEEEEVNSQGNHGVR